MVKATMQSTAAVAWGWCPERRAGLGVVAVNVIGEDISIGF
jgi:hypothetical protein